MEDERLEDEPLEDEPLEDEPPPPPPLLGERRKEARAMWDAIPVKVGRKPL